QKEKGPNVGAFTTYKDDLAHFCEEAKQRGAIPVLITSMTRRNFDHDGKVVETLGDYPQAVRQLAKERDWPLIDLNAMSKSLYEVWGPDKSSLAFAPGDRSHHNNYGSYEL